MVVVEDVHWADDATLDLLVFLGRRLADTPSTLVLTLREHTPDAPPRLAEVLGHLARSAAHPAASALPPLTLEAVARLAEGTHVEPARVHAVTAGNPFFVTEVLASEGEEVPARCATPSSVARPGCRRVPGQPWRPRPWCPTGSSSTCCSRSAESTPADLEECERADLLEIGSRVATYRHELARNAVLDSLPAVRRQQLHAAVVRAPDHPLRAPRGAHRPPRRPRRRRPPPC